MYRKNIEHVAVVALKHFFNLDHEISYGLVCIFILVCASGSLATRQVIYKMNELVRDIKTSLLVLRADLTDKEQPGTLVPARTSRNYVDKEIVNWNMNR